MMRMVVTTPNIFKNRRPEWLGPFNFFLFPIVSEDFGGYPASFNKSNFAFITPMESDRRKWRTLVGINLYDGQSYQISMSPTGRQDRVVPDSLRIILNQYLKKPEAKSLAPDGTPCTWKTQGLLRRALVLEVIPVGKETDRHWYGEDPSMLEFEVKEYRKNEKMVVAELSDRNRWRNAGLRYGMRKSGLSQKAVTAILHGEPVRIATLATFQRAMERIAHEP
jgi:hypothetical protein